jgi:hypothetical protein
MVNRELARDYIRPKRRVLAFLHQSTNDQDYKIKNYQDESKSSSNTPPFWFDVMKTRESSITSS